MSRKKIFSLERININSREDLVLAITFDYLIIPDLIPGYEYYKGIITNIPVLVLRLLSRYFRDSSQFLCQRLQIWENPCKPYYFKFDWCGFTKSRKYLFSYDCNDWLTHSIKLDPHYRCIIKNRIGRYVLNSIYKHKCNLTKEFLKKYHLDYEIINSSFKIGILKQPYHCWEIMSDQNVKFTKNRIRGNIQVLGFQTIRRKLVKNTRETVKDKIFLLQELLSSRRICEFPLCTKFCFKPRRTCLKHRYLEYLNKQKVIRPSTEQLLGLEKSITVI